MKLNSSVYIVQLKTTYMAIIIGRTSKNLKIEFSTKLNLLTEIDLPSPLTDQYCGMKLC